MKIKKKRKTIGFLIDWTEEPYQTSIFTGVADFAQENDINLKCYVTGGLDSPREYEKPRNVLFNFVNENNVDALVVMSGSIGNYVGVNSLRKFLKKYSSIPLISIALNLNEFPSVLIDNENAMHDLIVHLIEKHNYKKIAFIKGPENNLEANARFAAYTKTLQEHNIKLNEKLIVNGNFEIESGIEAIEILINERKVKFDAIIAANDNMALGALEELQSRNIKIPSEVAIVGFDDLEMGKYAVLPLTTVRQPLYEQGRVACELALKIANGKKIPNVLKLPSEIIIRESCGCLSNNTINACSGAYIVTEKDFENAFHSNEEKIIKELISSNNDIGDNYKKEYFIIINRILKSFFHEISEKNYSSFLNTWKESLSMCITKGFAISALQGVLSILRKNIIPCIKDRDTLIRAEDLLQQARVMIGEAAQRAETLQKILALYESQQLREIGEELMTVFEVKKQMDILYKELPKLGIKSCYLSLYDNPEKSLKKSRLFLGFTKKGRIKINNDGILFDSEKLIPKKIFPKNKRYSFIIEELSDATEHIGFALFEIEPREGQIYEMLRNRLSSALKGAVLISKIKMQAVSLEEQVKERTHDLTLANQKLQTEISGRKQIEEKLKEALFKLALTNEELRSLSLRDELTRLYNRRGFLTLGEQHLKLARRMKKDFLLFFIDLDDLKVINDNHGHQEGDYIIIKTGEVLKETFRQADVVARIGGDEFTVLSVDTSKNDEDEIKKRLMENIDKFNEKINKPYKLSMSVGISSFDIKTTSNFEELLAIADKKLYEQKRIKKENQNKINTK